MSVKVVYEAASSSGTVGSGGDLGLVLLGRGQGLGEAFEGHVAAGDQPDVVLLGKDGADQADDGGAVGKNADDVGTPADLAVQAFQRVVGPDLAPVLAGEGGEGEKIVGGRDQELGRLREAVVGAVPRPGPAAPRPPRPRAGRRSSAPAWRPKAGPTLGRE
jgi:hypothetical protein